MRVLPVPVLPLLNAVSATLGDETGRPFSLGDTYDLAEDDPFPYGVVHLISSTRWGPSLVSDDLNADVIVQVDSVGRRTDQAIQLCDRVRVVLLEQLDDGAFATTIALPPGSTIGDRGHYGGPTPPTKEGPDPMLVYTTSEQYQFRLLGDMP